MKKSLIVLLAIICTTIPVFNDIDAFVKQNSKLLVMNRSVDTFNTNVFYKIKC